MQMMTKQNLRRGVISAALAGLLLAGCGDSGAERQKVASEITKGVEDYLTLIEGPSQPIRIRHDKVTVTPAEDGKSYLVAITGLRYGSESKDALEPSANFGEVGYRLTPQGDDQYLVSDLKAPKEISIAGKDGKSEGTVKFETTAFTATWSKPLQNFLKFDWQLKDITAIGAAEGSAAPREMFKIATASIAGDGKENGKGLLDQVSKITMNGFTASDPIDGTSFKLDKLVGNVTVEKLDFPAYRQMMEKINAFGAKYAPNGEPAPNSALTEEDRKALADMVRAFPKMMSAYGYDFSAEGLTATDAQGGALFHLTQAGMALGLKGIDTDHAEMNFSIKHDGLTMNGPEFQDPMLKAVLPKSGNLSLVATDLPIPSLVEGIAQAVPEMTSADPQVAQGGQFMMMGAMMSALSKSTIQLRIDPSAIETEKARLTADGALKLAMETPQKAVGVINLALLGLDDLMDLAKSLADQSPDAMQAMSMLGMLKNGANREAGADGKPVDKFKVDLTETGMVLINGKQLEELMMMPPPQ
jgi:hypothetical protein